jgi:alkanesulfonate monooxygenase SsuD/methylene tetrahydromethanopterin reductase-like flavin-dependent oxidoreductase (luciferase family)
VQVGVMVTSHNHRDWDRLLAEDYGRPPQVPDSAIVDASLVMGDMVEPLGYDSLWCAEHYGTAYAMQANPLQWLAFWAGRTERIDMGSAVVVLPWWQPFKLVHEIGMLDLLLRGRRFHLGVGRGVAAHEYASFGIPREESRARFKEMIEILRLADENERTPEYHGEMYRVPPFSVRPRPRHKGELTRKIRAAFNTPSSMEVAADLGLSQMFVAQETPAMMRMQIAKYNALRARRNLPPDQPTTMLYMHCSTDADEIAAGHRYVGEQGWATRNHYAMWNNPEDFSSVKGYEEYAQKFSPDAPAEQTANDHLKFSALVGTPDELFEQIKTLQESLSLEYLIVNPAHGTKPGKEARASLKLFAEEVLPAVQALATPLHEHSIGSAEMLEVETSIGGGVG